MLEIVSDAKVEDQKLSERQMGVVDYFAGQLAGLQASYNETYARLQAYVTEAAKAVGIDLATHQFDPATGTFSPLPEQSEGSSPAR